MEVVRALKENSDGSTTPCWKAIFNFNGNTYEEFIGTTDKLSEEEAKQMAKEIAKEVEKSFIIDNLVNKIKEKEKPCPILEEFSKVYIEYVKDKKGSWDRDERSIYHLNHLLGMMKLNEITCDKLKEYQSVRLKERSRKNGELIKPSTVNKELACLSYLFNIAKEKGVFHGDNPRSKVKFLYEDNKRSRVLTPEEKERLLELSPPHLKSIIITALNTAMRESEILHLRWEDVDLKKSVITLKADSNKSGKTRPVYLNSTMINLPLEQQKITGNGEFVFLNSKGKPYKSADSMKNAFKNLCKRAKIEGFWFHDLRRTSATNMYEEEPNMKMVSLVLGHSDTRVTERYVQPPDKSLRDFVERIASKNKYD